MMVLMAKLSTKVMSADTMIVRDEDLWYKPTAPHVRHHDLDLATCTWPCRGSVDARLEEETEST